MRHTNKHVGSAVDRYGHRTTANTIAGTTHLQGKQEAAHLAVLQRPAQYDLAWGAPQALCYADHSGMGQDRVALALRLS